MRMYRTGWLVVGIALLLAGVGAAAHASPRALLIVFVVVAVACSLVSLSAIGMTQIGQTATCPGTLRRHQALVGGTIAVALVGFAELVGQRVGLLAFAVLASSPPAVDAYGRWLRSIPTPSAAHLDALARAFANAGVGYVGITSQSGAAPNPGDQLAPTKS